MILVKEGPLGTSVVMTKNNHDENSECNEIILWLEECTVAFS